MRDEPYGDDQARWEALEDRQAELIDLRFRRDIGLDVGPEEARAKADAVEAAVRALVLDYRDDPEAFGLVSRLLQMAHATPLATAVLKAREKHLTFDDLRVGDGPVTPYNYIRFLQAEDDPARRRAFFARWTAPNPEVDAADEARRTTQNALADELGVTPLEEFLSAEGMTEAELRTLLTSVGDGLRPVAGAQLRRRREEMLSAGGFGEEWEDAVTVLARGERMDAAVKAATAGLDGVGAVLRTARTMGFDPNTIRHDLEDRPRKAAGATAWRVRIPQDVRISAKPSANLLRTAQTLYHEMGHALHFISVDPDLPLPARIGFSFGTSEVFSYWLESVFTRSEYVERDLGIAPDIAAVIARLAARQQFGASIASIAACALAIVDYWTEYRTGRVLSREQIGDRLGGYLTRFLGFAFPPTCVRHYTGNVLALEMNTLGYPVAIVRLGHLLDRLEAMRSDWWSDPSAAEAVIRPYMRGGRRAGFMPDLLDTGPFLTRARAA